MPIIVAQKACQTQPKGTANQIENKRNPCDVARAKAKYIISVVLDKICIDCPYVYTLWLKVCHEPLNCMNFFTKKVIWETGAPPKSFCNVL